MNAEPVSAGPATAADAPPAVGRRFPPVAELAIGSLALVVIGGILMASYVPRRPPLGVPAVLTAVSAALVLTSVFLLSRLRPFAWGRFFLVFRWALLAYVISAGMIGFAFVRDHTRGDPAGPRGGDARDLRAGRAGHHRVHRGALLLAAVLRGLILRER